MEHDLLQLLHLPSQDHLMVSSGFLDVGGGPVHFPGSDGGFIGQVDASAGHDDCGWMEDLLQLGDELFRDNAAGTGDQLQPWQCDGGSPGDDPPPSMSLDGDRSPPSGEQGAGEVASEQQRDDGDVSAATRKRRDRSKTIVSERKRRVRMKEKLYELRSLVPNITKMDKASIIADAVEYVKNLQSHARKLKEEVATLEARPRSPRQGKKQQNRFVAAARSHQGAPPADGDAGSTGRGARVTHVGATQVGEGRFFVTVECERRDGAAAPLCAAVESLACFRVESSSLGRSGTDRLVSTLTLKASGQVGDATAIREGMVKLWVMAALLEEGFRPEATVEIS
ncbi:transcription factor BHLH156-like [Phragmites australis]|uniref:transcription factor BHLH156-like n=1 Tax=Phragmites australis TaxID=29695 RepID=UPI002D799BA3|nr:transcription factor BHLH156-like [Phragmites australis]